MNNGKPQYRPMISYCW